MQALFSFAGTDTVASSTVPGLMHGLDTSTRETSFTHVEQAIAFVDATSSPAQSTINLET
jgi:hypothetical protein